jgi:hypothetical protein
MRNRMTKGEVTRYSDEQEKGQGIMKSSSMACVAKWIFPSTT